MALLAALLLGAAQIAAEAGVAGHYETDQMEVAAALELQPDGHFRYALEYGAVSERAEGAWRFNGRTVFLTSKDPPGARFDNEPLLLDDGDLLLGRHETIFRFRPVEP